MNKLTTLSISCLLFLSLSIYAADRIVGVVDILPLFDGENKKDSAKSEKIISAASYETGSYQEAFKITSKDLPEMIDYMYDRKLAIVYSCNGDGGEVKIRKNGKFGLLGPSSYYQYFSYPDLLKEKLIRNDHATELYQLAGSTFSIKRKIEKKFDLKYRGYITVENDIWIYVDVYSQDTCGDGEAKLLDSGWVKGYTMDKPTLWVYAKGC